MIASSRRQTEIAEMLIRAGARVNISDLSDYSSFSLPPQEIAKHIELSSEDSKVNSNIQGSALDIAVIQGDTEMVSLLLKYEAKVLFIQVSY